MKKCKFVLAGMLIFFLIPIAQTMESAFYPFASPAEAKRFASLTNEVRCLVCQNQTIADSNAPLANDLRGKIYRMILNHQSDEEIKNFLVKRYGEFILLTPRLNKITLILWFFPLFGILFALCFLYRMMTANKN